MATREERLDTLAASLTGRLLRPGDDGYDEARRVHNGLVDKRPALIARCRGTADVADAVRLAREEGLEVSVRGGGHNVAGRAVVEGGLMIDLAEMKGIHVDPDARTARAQGGCTWAELNREAALHGLAVTGGAISSTGIAGFTLGGGLGWLMGVYGLAADNLLSAEVVTATGDVLNVGPGSHPDLFWALRGGGGNFGVVTSFEYRLHPVSWVVGGLVAHPFEAARDVLRFYRDFTASAPDELTAFSGLVHAPDGSGAKLAAIVVCHAGPEEQAERDLAPLRAFGEPALVEIGPLPYPVMNTLLDAAYPRGALNYWKSSFLGELRDDFVETAVRRFETTPSPMNAILLEHFHGAVTRASPTETAVQHRAPGYNMLITSVWLDPGATDENVAWTRETYEAFRPFFAERRWLNYLDDDDAADAVRAAYGPNYARLLEVKRRYDPDNVFHLNHNIDPAG
ncbi:MAG TPA: FAD-binding oxidoreductase [Gaiellaceae bacterium]|jgi:FAD/FMN-containing dehydrogenase|nr:FAD-binding oxidoreductase [Gaiellaceae bacterium]